MPLDWKVYATDIPRMSHNRERGAMVKRSSPFFLFAAGLSAISLAVVAQVLVSTERFLAGGLCFGAALMIAAFSLFRLPGPEIGLDFPASAMGMSGAAQLRIKWKGLRLERVRTTPLIFWGFTFLSGLGVWLLLGRRLHSLQDGVVSLLALAIVLVIVRQVVLFDARIADSQRARLSSFLRGIKTNLISGRTAQSSLALGVFGLGLGVAGQTQLHNQPIWGTILTLAAVFLTIYAFPVAPGSNKASVPDLPVAVAQTPGRIPRRALWCAGLAILANILAFALFDTSISALVPWLLHFLSIGLLILALVWIEWGKPAESARPASWHWLELVILAFIFGLGLFMRLNQLDQYPYGIYFDEAVNGLEAAQIFKNLQLLPVFVPSTHLPAHFIYLVGIAINFLGSTSVALRLVSVLFGVGTVVAAYFAGRELFDRRSGLVLAFFLAVSRWDINWSRIGMHGVSVPFFELLSMAMLLRALRCKRLLDYALTGLVFGFSLCFYIPLRFFPLVPAVFLLALWLKRRDLLRVIWPGLVVLAFGAWFAATPEIQFAIRHPDDFFVRFQTASIFNGKTPLEGWQSVARTTGEHLLMFNYRGDRNGRHNLPGQPMLDPVSAGLMILGLGFCLRRIRQPAALLLVAWLLLMLVPGILTLDYESPQSLRAIGSLPAAFLLALVPLHALWKEWDRLAPVRMRTLFPVGLAMLLAGAGVYNYQMYFDRQVKSFDSWSAFSSPETYAGKLMAQLGNQFDYYISIFYYNTPTVRFLAPAAANVTAVESHATLPLPLDGSRDVVILVDAERKPFYQQAMMYYPNGQFHEFLSPDGQTAVYEIRLTKNDITSIQGLSARYYKDADWNSQPVREEKDGKLEFDWKEGSPLAFPFGVEWQGILFAHKYGPYQLIVESPAQVELFVDGGKVEFQASGKSYTAQLVLARGNHTLKLRAHASPGHFAFKWQPPDEALQPFSPGSLLLPEVTNHGLLGRYYANADWQDPPAFLQIDPWIHFYFQNPPLNRPYTVEWQGKILIEKGGEYRFMLESIDESTLYLDDQLVVDDHSPNQEVESGVALSQGYHSIRLRFGDRTGSTHINLYWTPPGGTREPVPQGVLFPPEAGPEQLSAPVGPSVTAVPAQIPSTPGAKPDLQQVQVLWQTGECGPAKGQFSSPHGISLDPQGNLWVADTGNNRVVELDANGNVMASFGSVGDEDGQFREPIDLSVGPDGSLIVLDSVRPDVLSRFSGGGQFLSALGASLGTYNPRGIGMNSAGNIFIADTGGGRVLYLAPSGQILEKWSLALAGKNPGQPVSVAPAPDGGVYVVDMANGWVWKFIPGGKSSSWEAAISGDTLNGSRLALGADQILYLSDPDGRRVVLYSLDGQLLGSFVAGDRPVGIAPGPGGVLYVTDQARCKVSAFKIKPN